MSLDVPTERRFPNRRVSEPRSALSWSSALRPRALVVATAAAVIVSFLPNASDWFIFDRAQIAAGQLWRLVTAHWVHFSTSHLVWNLVALGAAGLLASGIKARTWKVMATSALAIGVAVFWLEPELRFFCGLSGVATAMIAWAVASRSKSQPAFRALALVGILLLITKLAWEATTTHSVFASLAAEGVRISWIAHLVGLLVGAASGLTETRLGADVATSTAARILPCSRA